MGNCNDPQKDPLSQIRASSAGINIRHITLDHDTELSGKQAGI